MERDEFLAALRRTLETAPPDLDGLLALLCRYFGAQTATLHAAEPTTRHLHLAAARGVPPPLLPKIARIPYGKGMAGLCAERLAPVTVCNLQTDTSGTARPGAKLTGVEGAIVVPARHSETAPLAGTLGIGKAVAHDYTADEQALLMEVAALLVPYLEQRPAEAE